MEIKGTISVLEDTKEFGSNGFTKRLIVVDTQEEYVQHIPVEFIKDKCSILDQYKVGDQVTVSTNVQGRKWTNQQGEDKYFLSLTGWKINKEGNGASTPPPAQQFEPATDVNDEDYDDLPF